MQEQKKQKRKMRSFIIIVALAIVFLVSGIICNRISVNIKNNNYDALVSISTSTSLSDKIDSYKQAIEIYPDRLEAYLKLIEAYEDEGTFSKAENDQFLAIYNEHKDGFDTSDVKEAELNYKVGMMYFNYYTENNGPYSFSTRIQKAYPFFTLENSAF